MDIKSVDQSLARFVRHFYKTASVWESISHQLVRWRFVQNVTGHFKPKFFFQLPNTLNNIWLQIICLGRDWTRDHFKILKEIDF